MNVRRSIRRAASRLPLGRRTWLIREAEGFTLVEMLVGITLLTIVMSTIGTSSFQALKTQQRISEDGLAVNELRKGLGWFAEDAKMATSTNLTDGAPATTTVTMSWRDYFNVTSTTGVLHTASYALNGDRLERTYDSSTHTVARDVVTALFSLGSTTVTAQIEVNAEPGTTRTLSVDSVMRAAD